MILHLIQNKTFKKACLKIKPNSDKSEKVQINFIGPFFKQKANWKRPNDVFGCCKNAHFVSFCCSRGSSSNIYRKQTTPLFIFCRRKKSFVEIEKVAAAKNRSKYFEVFSMRAKRKKYFLQNDETSISESTCLESICETASTFKST